MKLTTDEADEALRRRLADAERQLDEDVALVEELKLRLDAGSETAHELRRQVSSAESAMARAKSQEAEALQQANDLRDRLQVSNDRLREETETNRRLLDKLKDFENRASALQEAHKSREPSLALPSPADLELRKSQLETRKRVLQRDQWYQVACYLLYKLQQFDPAFEPPVSNMPKVPDEKFRERDASIKKKLETVHQEEKQLGASTSASPGSSGLSAFSPKIGSSVTPGSDAQRLSDPRIRSSLDRQASNASCDSGAELTLDSAQLQKENQNLRDEIKLIREDLERLETDTFKAAVNRLNGAIGRARPALKPKVTAALSEKKEAGEPNSSVQKTETTGDKFATPDASSSRPNASPASSSVKGDPNFESEPSCTNCECQKLLDEKNDRIERLMEANQTMSAEFTPQLKLNDSQKKTIAKLTGENGKLERDHQAAMKAKERELGSLREERDRHQTDLQELRQRLEALQAEKTSLEQEKTELEERLKITDQAKCQEDGEKEALKKKLEKLQRKYNSAKADKTELEEKLKRAKDKRDSLGRRVDDTSQELEELRQELVTAESVARESAAKAAEATEANGRLEAIFLQYLEAMGASRPTANTRQQ